LRRAARHVTERYENLSSDERAQVIAFLKSLRAPQSTEAVVDATR
jgi:hypothetical protein